MTANIAQNRRGFLRLGAATGGGIVLLGGTAIVPAAEPDKKPAEDISPAEDLMREHGVLNRILLVYDEVHGRLAAKKNSAGAADAAALGKAAKIIRTFVEDYHEKLEEEHLFPRFEKAGKLVELVKVLREQHQLGRALTERIAHAAEMASWNDAADRKKLAHTLRQFVRMYRPHEAREDTVLFPAIRGLMTAKEFELMGDQFEEKEHKLFGEHGFEDVVAQVAAIEKSLGIDDLARFSVKP